MRRRRGRTRGDGISRRKLLLGVGGVVGGGSLVSRYGAEAFTSASVPRSAGADVVTDPNGVVGLTVNSPVEKGTRDPLVDVANHRDGPLSVTVSLSTCTDGTLYDPSGASGCSVTFSVAGGTTETFDLESSVNNVTIPFTVVATAPGFRFQATRSTQSQGNVKSAVSVKKFQLPNNNVVATNQDEFTIKSIDLRDNDGDDDLVRRTFTVTDGNGDDVALTDTANSVAPDRTFAGTGTWTENNAKNFTLAAADDLTTGTTYNIRLTGYDADGNYDSATKTVTA